MNKKVLLIAALCLVSASVWGADDGMLERPAKNKALERLQEPDQKGECYTCEKCKKNFKKLRLLESHLVTHSNVRQFKCAQCKNSYKHKQSLVDHQKTHKNPNPFQCHYCEKKFAYSSALRRHINSHTRAILYRCQYCNDEFTDRGHHIRHEKKYCRVVKGQLLPVKNMQHGHPDQPLVIPIPLPNSITKKDINAFQKSTKGKKMSIPPVSIATGPVLLKFPEPTPEAVAAWQRLVQQQSSAMESNYPEYSEYSEEE